MSTLNRCPRRRRSARGNVPLRRIECACLLVLASSILTSCRMFAPPGGGGHRSGYWTLTYENDLFVGKDNNYTSGAGLSWVSCAVTPQGSHPFLQRIVEAASFLPGIGDPDSQHHVGFLLAQSMFTPADITDPDPPESDRPYAGVLALDTSVYARQEDALHAWTLKLGVVGPSSLADRTQKFIHDLVGSDDPRGWDYQLHDELLANLDYTYSRRLWEGDALGLSWDITPNVGGALGNYAVFANAGISARLGRNMPANFGGQSLRAGTQSNAVILGPPSDRFGGYLFAGLQAFAAERFLPQDGNTWGSSRRVDTEELVGAGTLGFALSLEGLLLTFTFTRFTDTFEGQVDDMEYGSLSLTWGF